MALFFGTTKGQVSSMGTLGCAEWTIMCGHEHVFGWMQFTDPFVAHDSKWEAVGGMHGSGRVGRF